MNGFNYKKTFIIFLLSVSIAGNFFLFFLWQNQSGIIQEQSSLKTQYKYLSRRALHDYTNDLLINFLPLRRQLHTIVDPYQESVAIFFEYLPTGTTIGINEDAEFTAASLLKVPVVMAYFHKREVLGQNTDATVAIQAKELDNHYGDLYKKGAGYKINLADAVKFSLTRSDNTASLILADQISEDDFNFVYEGLDIAPALDGDSPIITAQQYTSILKALYFSSILNKDDSEEILELLTKTEFNNMLPAGVAKNVPVAHKIGLIDKQIYQDCGIVYAPNRPYALCMISKSDKQTAITRMRTISKVVYDYVVRQ